MITYKDATASHGLSTGRYFRDRSLLVQYVVGLLSLSDEDLTLTIIIRPGRSEAYCVETVITESSEDTQTPVSLGEQQIT